MIKRLVNRFAYMSDENLKTLADVVIEHAQGAARNVWPVEASVINHANNLQRCPPVQHRVVSSWLSSVEGPKAVAAGVEVELYEYLAKHRRPPSGGYDNRIIREKAERNAHSLGLITDKVGRGTATSDERQWLTYYVDLRQHVRGIIEAGQTKRAAA